MQIYRLCEKQYRKGFQQGFHASHFNKLTLEEVNEFRAKGAEQDYKKVVNPLMGYSEVPSERIKAELSMSDTDELFEFLMLL